MATSKTKKVVAPIDERETFVSLRKTFADSEQSAQEKLKVLYLLQQTDNEIEKLVQLRGQLPSEVASLEEGIAQKRSKIAHQEELLAGYTQFIEAQNAEIVNLDAEIGKYEEMKSNISNSREFDSIEKEIENNNILREVCRKNIDKAQENISKCNDELESLKSELAVREEDLKAKNDELAGIISSTAEQEAQLKGKREEFIQKLDERTVSAYERIRASVHNHLAVVPLYNGDSCGGCFNEVTAQRIIDIQGGKKLIICEHCGRIIVNPEA